MPVLVYIIYSRTSRPIGQEVLYGAGDEARTRYLHLGKVALYRMSYTRILKWCLRSESNQRHADFQSAALPTELQRHLFQMRVRAPLTAWVLYRRKGRLSTVFYRIVKILSYFKVKSRMQMHPGFLEVPPRFELGNEGFADLCLTTWPRYHIKLERVTRLELATSTLARWRSTG